MSLTLNMVGGSSGGGISDAYAIISVSYPLDGTCTCTDGIETLTATGGTGFYVFAIPYAATWTVSVTNGIYTSLKSVVISNQYQVESVALSYTKYLFRNGSYDGTWEAKAWWSNSSIQTITPTISVSDSLFMALYTNDYRGGFVPNSEALDLNKDTISYTWTAKSGSGTYTIKPIVFTPYANGFTRTIEGNVISSSSGTGTIDISNLSSGSYYFGVLLYTQSGNISVTFSEVKLT